MDYTYHTVPLGDWLEKKKVPAIIIKQQCGFPMSTKAIENRYDIIHRPSGS